jgi:hypothetical protein
MYVDPRRSTLHLTGDGEMKRAVRAGGSLCNDTALAFVL